MANIKEQLSQLSGFDAGPYPEAIMAYFEYYGLNIDNDFENVDHIFGSFQSNGEMLAAHVFRPKVCRGTVIVLHGYFSHTGQVTHLLRYLLGEGYAVAAYDMPGHGLSTGDRASIEDFASYSLALEDFTEILRTRLDGPYHLIGHSTGGAAIIDYMLTGQDDVFGKVILAGPLVRNVAWEAAKASYKMYSQFADRIPRTFRGNSSDKAFLESTRTDPLQAHTVPLKWVNALHVWNDKIPEMAPVQREVLIIQGDHDSTVAWKFNIEFIKNKFPAAQVMMIDGGRHELFNEAQPMRDEIFAIVGDYLQEQ